MGYFTAAPEATVAETKTQGYIVTFNRLGRLVSYLTPALYFGQYIFASPREVARVFRSLGDALAALQSNAVPRLTNRGESYGIQRVETTTRRIVKEETSTQYVTL